MENAPNVVKYSMYGEYEGFRAVFVYVKLSPNTREVFKCTWRIRRKYFSVLGKYAKSTVSCRILRICRKT
jgi:hypothetical protein